MCSWHEEQPARPSAKAPDIRTVAALAKVSIATVSRTINGSPAVSDRLIKRVWQAIEQLNYFPNTHARSLVSGRSRILGIIVENITNPFFPELIQNFEESGGRARIRDPGQFVEQRPGHPDQLRAPHAGAQGGGRGGDDLRRRRAGARPADAPRHSHGPGRVQAGRPQDQHHPAGLHHGDSGGGEPPHGAGPPQDRVPGRAAQAALGHHARKRLPHRDERGGPASGSGVVHRVRPHAARRRGGVREAAGASRSSPPRSCAPTT